MINRILEFIAGPQKYCFTAVAYTTLMRNNGMNRFHSHFELIGNKVFSVENFKKTTLPHEDLISCCVMTYHIIVIVTCFSISF